MQAHLPKQDFPLVVSRPPAGKAAPTKKAVKRFLDETRAALGRSLPSAPGLQPTVSKRTRRARPRPGAGRPPINSTPLDQAISKLQQLVWAHKTGWRPELDREGQDILNKLVSLATKAESLPELRRQRTVTAILLDRITEIYHDYSKGLLGNQAYEASISKALADLGIEPSPELLDALVVDKQDIDKPAYAHGPSPAKGAGPAETAKFTLAVVFEILGYVVPHSARSLQAVRSWSPAERARIATSQAFGSNVTLPPGMSPCAAPCQTVVELRNSEPSKQRLSGRS